LIPHNWPPRKTSTLTGRFVHLIRQGVDPARILAVTFTKKAADEMRRRKFPPQPAVSVASSHDGPAST
jgi:hypothetical protein